MRGLFHAIIAVWKKRSQRLKNGWGRLAEALDAKFLSSGMIIRAMEAETKNKMSNTGELIPTDVFYEWVLPYFERRDLFGSALILSSIGRWFGE